MNTQHTDTAVGKYEVIDKVGVAQEVRKQKLKEGQEIGEAVLDAEVKIGELMAATPKAANQYARDSGVTRKTDALKQAGFTGSDEKIRQMAQRFETLAAHPEIVAQAKQAFFFVCKRTNGTQTGIFTCLMFAGAVTEAHRRRKNENKSEENTKTG